MKAYLKPKVNSFGINRVVKALEKYIPNNLDIVESEEDSDLIILHVNGRNEHFTRQAKSIIEKGKQYAVIQYVLESSRNPNPQDWYELWNGAKVVWSYYDLKQYCSNFYHAPLAAKNDLFHKENIEKKYTVGTNGNCFKAECIGENHLATWQVGGNAVHVGENFDSNPIVDYISNVTDDELRVIYNQCKYFSALRRDDGFEIVAVEALLCGVRPILFDTANYRQWFDGLAEFIPESSPKNVVGSLKNLFKKEPRVVTDEEIEETKRRFNWNTIIGGFWERCMTSQY